jgi:hypothetical protein
MLQEIDDFGDFPLGGLVAGDVGEGRCRALFSWSPNRYLEMRTPVSQ